MKYRIYKQISKEFETYYIVKQRKLFGLYYGVSTDDVLSVDSTDLVGCGYLYRRFKTLADAIKGIDAAITNNQKHIQEYP